MSTLKLKCFTTFAITQFYDFDYLNYFRKVYDHKWPFLAMFEPIKYSMARIPTYSGQNENLKPLLDSNMGIVTIK